MKVRRIGMNRQRKTAQPSPKRSSSGSIRCIECSNDEPGFASRCPPRTPIWWPTCAPRIAAIGHPMSSATSGRCTGPCTFGEANAPASASSVSPGRKKPMSRPVSANKITKTPARPKLTSSDRRPAGSGRRRARPQQGDGAYPEVTQQRSSHRWEVGSLRDTPSARAVPSISPAHRRPRSMLCPTCPAHIQEHEDAHRHPRGLRRDARPGQAGGFAYPAINVTSSQTLNAAIQGFADAGSDGIVQVSTGGAEFLSGSRRSRTWSPARLRSPSSPTWSPKYHDQHRAAHRPLPEEQARRLRAAADRDLAGARRRGENPLFQSHMWDGSAVPLEENLGIADELLA